MTFVLSQLGPRNQPWQEISGRIRSEEEWGTFRLICEQIDSLYDLRGNRFATCYAVWAVKGSADEAERLGIIANLSQNPPYTDWQYVVERHIDHNGSAAFVDAHAGGMRTTAAILAELNGYELRAGKEKISYLVERRHFFSKRDDVKVSDDVLDLLRRLAYTSQTINEMVIEACECTAKWPGDARMGRLAEIVASLAVDVRDTAKALRDPKTLEPRGQVIRLPFGDQE